MDGDQSQSREGAVVTFTVINVDQRTDEWRSARAGRLTGSRAGDMMTRIKTGEAAARRDLRTQLVCERLTGIPQDDGYVNRDIQRGIDLEASAVGAWEAETGLVVRRTGFLIKDTLLAGCSLDGDIDHFDGIFECKCPKSATHLRYLREARVPPDYVWQCTHNLWITGAEWVEFASYDDRFPPELQLFRVRAYSCEFDIAAYDKAAREFLAEVDREEESVRALRKKAA